MTKKQMRTTARVNVTVVVDVASWGEDCTTGQVFDQASREAVGAVKRLIRDAGKNISMEVRGEPTVEMVTVFA